MSSSPKRSLGRQKIEMKKMTNESNLQVTFSKRRTGLFKKASELCTLCNAEVALVVFSPGDKVYSFGHPNADAIIDRYLTGVPPPPAAAINHRIEDQRRNRNTLRDLNTQLVQLNNKLETARKRGDDLIALNTATQAQFWWAKPIEEMNLAQLEQFKDAMLTLQKQVNTCSAKASVAGAEKPAAFFAGASSSSAANHLLQAEPPQVLPSQMIQPPMLGGGTMMPNDVFNNMGMGMGGGFGSGTGGHGFE